MANIRLTPNISSPDRRTSDGDFVSARGTRDGALFVSDWKQSLIMEGKGYHITVGALSTGIVGGGAVTVVNLDCPEFVISVPSGVSILPLRVAIQVQTGAPTDAQEVEILLAVDQDAAYAADGTVVSEVIYNMNTLHSNRSACTAISAATADITDPVLDIELARRVVEYDVVTSGTLGIACDLVYEPITPPIINGPAMLIGYWGGDTATIGGFAQVEWLELPTNTLK